MAELNTDLDKLANDAKDWKCKLLFNQAVLKQGEEGAEDVDIVDLCEFLPYISVMDRRKIQNFPPGTPPGTNYMFPERFKGLAGRGLLVVELKLAAIKCGYSLAIRNSKVEKNANSDRAFYCSLNCLHGKMCCTNSYHHVQKSTKAKYKTKFKRPTDKQLLCPFKIKLFLQKDSADRWPGRWFLSGETAKNCCHHYFHSEHEPGHMHVPMQLMTAEETKLAKDCSQLYLTASSSANLLSLRNKTDLDWKAKQLDSQDSPAPAEDDDDIPGQGCNDSDSDSDSSTHDMDISASMPRAAQNVLDRDVLATQRSQSDDVQILTQSSDHKYQVVLGKVQNILKLIGDDDAKYQTFLDALDKMIMDIVEQKRAGAAQAAASKNVDESTHCS
jgi:hypothetical protein